MRCLQSAALVAFAAVSACAHGPQPPVETVPNYAPVPGEPAPPNARLYADCFAQAASSGAYRRAADGGGDELILFTCTAAPAAAFYEALAPWSARIGSEFVHDGRTYRSTAKVLANMFGVDSCSASANGDHRCVISFNAGDFLDQ